jgi:hypothetical protein
MFALLHAEELAKERLGEVSSTGGAGRTRTAYSWVLADDWDVSCARRASLLPCMVIAKLHHISGAGQLHRIPVSDNTDPATAIAL